MFKSFPVNPPEKLPKEIEPCPIIEAAFEIRFNTSTPWVELPGVVSKILDPQFTERRELDLNKTPDEVKKHLPGAAYLPHYQFLSERFIINLAPQMVGFCVVPGTYPGWSVLIEELHKFLDRALSEGFINEGARLGVRYTDFFSTNIFKHISLRIDIAGLAIEDKERQFITVFKEGSMTVRLKLVDGALYSKEQELLKGSIFDIDVAINAMDFELESGNIIHQFAEAHSLIKNLFFGLITQEYLNTLNPTY
jgi:uncharacterized protein (TIGR04255 family)